MGMTDDLNNQVLGWGLLVISIIVISLVLIKFKTVNAGNSFCPGSNVTQSVYNVTHDFCQQAGNATRNSSISSLGTSVNTSVTALAEPVSWISIVIIAVIGFAILKLFQKK